VASCLTALSAQATGARSLRGEHHNGVIKPSLRRGKIFSSGLLRLAPPGGLPVSIDLVTGTPWICARKTAIIHSCISPTSSAYLLSGRLQALGPCCRCYTRPALRGTPWLAAGEPRGIVSRLAAWRDQTLQALYPWQQPTWRGDISHPGAQRLDGPLVEPLKRSLPLGALLDCYALGECSFLEGLYCFYTCTSNLVAGALHVFAQGGIQLGWTTVGFRHTRRMGPADATTLRYIPYCLGIGSLPELAARTRSMLPLGPARPRYRDYLSS
jgi:hypothetical protein